MFAWRGPERSLLCGTAGNLWGCHRLRTNLLCQLQEAPWSWRRLEPHARPLQTSVLLASGMLPRLLLGLQTAGRDVVLGSCFLRVPAVSRGAGSPVTLQGGATLREQVGHPPPLPITWGFGQRTFVPHQRSSMVGHRCVKNTPSSACQLWSRTNLPISELDCWSFSMWERLGCKAVRAIN